MLPPSPLTLPPPTPTGEDMEPLSASAPRGRIATKSSAGHGFTSGSRPVFEELPAHHLARLHHHTGLRRPAAEPATTEAVGHAADHLDLGLLLAVVVPTDEA